MPSPDAPRPALEHARVEVARQLAERAAEPDAPLLELRALQERLQLIDAALAAGPAAPLRPRRWPPALWPALAVAVLLSIVAAVPVRSVPFTLEAKAHAVALQLDAAGDLGPQLVEGELRIEGQTLLESPAPTLRQDAERFGSSPLWLRAPQLLLRGVQHPAASTLTVRAGAPVQVTVDASRPLLRVDIEFSGASQWRVGDAGTATSAGFAQAEWVRASVGDAARPAQRPAPLDLWLGLAPGKSLSWTTLRPSALQFVERRASASGESFVASSLEQARFALPVTASELQLGPGDRIEMAGLELESFELNAGDSIAVRLSGTARVLRTRTGDFERSLKPSLLEYVVRHHALGMFWSTALFLWGAIAWVRKQFDDVRG